MLGAEDVKNTQITSTTDTVIANNITTPETTSKPNDVVIPGEVARSKIAEYFGVNTKDIGKYDHDINRIIDYVNSFNPQNTDDIIHYVKSLGARLGSSNYEQSIKTISRYLYLNNQKTQIERDMERMTRQ